VPWAAAMFRTEAAARVDAVLAGMPASASQPIRRALRYAAHSAGGLSDPNVLSLAPDVDAAHALDQVRRRRGADSGHIFVVNRGGRLAGVVGLAEVVAAPPESPLASIMETDVVSIEAAEDAAAIAGHASWLRWRSLPVVDTEGVLVGVIRYDDIQRLVLHVPAVPFRPIALPVSLAELFWLGLTGIADGLARTVALRVETDDR